MSSPQLTIDQLLAIRSINAAQVLQWGSEPPQWSPDGKSVVFVAGLGGAPDVWSLNTETGSLQRLTIGMGGTGFLATYQMQWSPNGDYISWVSTNTGNDEVWLWPTDGAPSFQLTTLGGRVKSTSWAPDGKSLVVSGDRNGTFDIYRVDVPSGQATQLTDHADFEVYANFTPDGRIIYVRLNERWTDHDVILMNADGSDPQVVLTNRNMFDYQYGRTFGYPEVSPDGQSFLFRSDRSGWFNIWQAPVDGNGEPRQIAPTDAEQSDAVWSPDGKQIAYIENHNGTFDLRVVSADGGEPQVLVAPEMGACAGPNWSPDGKKIIYLRSSPTAPQDLWLLDVESGESRQLTNSILGGGVQERLVRPEKIQYGTFDGKMINAYLYHPPAGTEGSPYPGIMLVHGGPTSQYMDSFQLQAQFFALNGYVVMTPNVRGSSGYGREFEDLNNEDWGGGDLQDVVAGVDYLKALDYVDSENIGITGGSYGGILTMYAVTFTPGVFQAAVAQSGYPDLEDMYDEQEKRHIQLLRYELGDLPGSEEVYRRCSAIHKIAQVTTPTFVLHGEGKYPNTHSSKIFAFALEAAYKPFWYKAYQGENYYVASPANVKRALSDMLAFFDFYLKGKAHNFPEGERPLTHMSGIVPAPSPAMPIRTQSML